MKIWLLLAALALAPSVACAHLTEANEGARVALIRDIEVSRAALLPRSVPPASVTVRFEPRLDVVKASIAAARTPAELVKGMKDLADWKTDVRRELMSASRAFAGRPDAQVLSAGLLRQQSAARRFGADAAAWNSGASWGKLFDNQSRLAAAEPVRAAAPAAADDPARYAKIRALLLSQGVGPEIIDTAISEGIRQKLDPMLVLSVINQESHFRRNARNLGSGAMGLMQLTPETAADMGVRGSLYDPAVNIKAGVKYMNWIANSFFRMNLDMSDISRVSAEKLKLVLASYNWGVGNVRRIVASHGAAALDRMAPKETRDYIAEIPARIRAWFASFGEPRSGGPADPGSA